MTNPYDPPSEFDQPRKKTRAGCLVLFVIVLVLAFAFMVFLQMAPE